MSQIKLNKDVTGFLEKEIGLYINGEYISSESKKTFEVLNPANENIIANVSEANEKDIDKAVQAAKNAFYNKWKYMEAAERSELIYKFAELLERDKEIIAQLETLDNGKPYNQALEDDIEGTIQHFKYYAGWATKIFGKTTNIDPNYVTYTIHEPIGVVGQIIPWNFPLAMAGWKMGAALAAGCTIVLKPAENTPLSILYVASLFKEAGFPDGVVNIVSGMGNVAGEFLVSHKDVRKVAFTGSTKTGSNIMKQASNDIKSITLELGGKSPSIVMDDVDLETSIDGILDGTMYNTGQNCSATTRVYVQRNIYEKVLELLKEKAEKINVGDGFDSSTQMGPIISQKQFDSIMNYIEIGKKEGAKLITGGNRVNTKGYFIEPTIFADVTDDMTICKEEIFGPVMCVLPFDTIDEVIERANNSNYGLAASVWTENIKVGHYISSKLETGTVWVNDFGLEWETMPFGGYKQSGIGREMGGDYGLMNYIEVKSIFINMELNDK